MFIEFIEILHIIYVRVIRSAIDNVCDVINLFRVTGI